MSMLVHSFCCMCLTVKYCINIGPNGAFEQWTDLNQSAALPETTTMSIDHHTEDISLPTTAKTGQVTNMSIVFVF